MTSMRDELYRAMGLGHATLAGRLAGVTAHARSDDRGQGTVEYIGLVLLLAAVMAVVVTTGNGRSIGTTVIKQVKEAVSSVGGA